MRPVLLAGAVAILILGGCKPTPKETVSVDLSKIQLAAWPTGTPDSPAPERAVRPQPFVLPGLPAMDIVTAPKDVEAVNRLLADQQAETQRKLQKSLTALYARMARRDERGELAKLNEREQKRFDEINQTIRTVFEAYAAERMPLAARLAFLAGFPDPNPESIPPEKKLGNVSGAKFNEAKNLRQQIADLDANFQAAVSGLLAAIDNENLFDRTDTRLKIELNSDELRQRAATEAANQVRQAGSKLKLMLAGSRTIHLPAVPARRIVPPAVAAPSPAPKVDSELDRTGGIYQKRQLEGELRMWAALRRYDVQTKGRDATQEFIQWRNENQAGR